ncbi:hypothetical protein GCM10020367_18050 [Streptomyces sannanensis]|uniref:Alpha/beta fold hydrolase n=1 Tax=Streptomyces sannanensis TaxID=285536 RepID=A0ABP6S883_9ACTN
MATIFECDGERLSCSVTEPDDPDPATTVVLLHGAGTSSKERLAPLARDFAARGCRTIAFDFSGHGDSSGELRELSLERRFTQARNVIDAYAPAGGRLILVGFSMSGQTVADLVDHYGDRVAAVGLGTPAVYAARAWPVRFGGGFTGIIRTPDSWRDSKALEVFRGFPGRAVLALPEVDAVIPSEVTESVTDALASGSRFTRLDFAGADHQLAAWFRDHPGDRERFVDAMLDEGLSATRAWAEKQLPEGQRITGLGRLRGGWTSQMRLLHVEGAGTQRDVVLRSFVKPFFRRHAPGLLTREADILTLLAGSGVPAADLLAVDAEGEHCEHPSLLMSRLPGRVRADEEDLDRRIGLLAEQLVRIHALEVPEGARPRPYQAWTSPERVRIPEATERPELWARAVDVLRGREPRYEGCFLHRDFHPANVLFTGAGESLRVSGVVDWVETSWGPADLDVAHCSTALALLHGTRAAILFGERYAALGGRLSPDPAAQLYWRLLDALAFAPDAEKVAVAWRELGRTDLTPDVLTGRLEDYIAEVLHRFG